MKEPIIETYVPQNKRLPYQVAAGGIVTLAFAIYFIIDTLKKWY